MPVKNKNNLIDLIKSHQDQIRSLGVKRVGIFGSFVRNQAKKNSDIDLFIEFQKGHKNFDNYMHLSFLLEDISGRNVEIITPESLSPYIGPYILKNVEYVSFMNSNIYGIYWMK